ncbi:MAG: hypothetical protein H6R29_305 [Methanomicrobia archaeon]|nr:hypothetical protein [Methanomicrobia archaeon]
MDREGHGRPDPGPLDPLVVVKGPPLGATVNEILVDDQAAVLADQLGPFIVVDQLPAAALGADGLGSWPTRSRSFTSSLVRFRSASRSL